MWFILGCPRSEPEPDADPLLEAVMSHLDADRAWQDLVWLGSEARWAGEAHWQASQDHCVEVLEQAGFHVERHDFGVGTNVVGTLPGRDPDLPVVILTAHYDSVQDCPGADDNASGTAALLEIARTLATQDWERGLVVACWDQEEQGLLGAKAWASRADGEVAIAINYNLEMVGFSTNEPNTQEIPQGFDMLFEEAYAVAEAEDFAGNFLAAIGDEGAAAQVALLQASAAEAGVRFAPLIVEHWLKNAPQVSDLRRSDHAVFWARDIPAIMITDTSEFRYDAYHCVNGTIDEVEQLDFEFFAGAVATVAGAVARSLRE